MRQFTVDDLVRISVPTNSKAMTAGGDAGTAMSTLHGKSIHSLTRRTKRYLLRIKNILHTHTLPYNGFPRLSTVSE